jgi:hypothetical protein
MVTWDQPGAIDNAAKANPSEEFSEKHVDWFLEIWENAENRMRRVVYYGKDY